ncbi:MAG TPA: helix-turn-helix domain-containing protein [Tepidisphaeraceae bacterium]|jgi:phage terminase Nu1 subunit (DNA packaging protein)|nr:helix-turn-helix domain-containing protein [Tepidisphaeraceae bacterium]
MGTTTRTLTTAELCDLLDIDESTVKRWVAKGCPHDKSGKGKARQFDEGEVVAWMKSQGLTGERGRPKELISPTLEAARIRKENALAERYEIMVARDKGVLVEAAAVEADNVQKFVTVKNRLLGISASLAPSLVGLDAPAIEKLLDAQIRDVLQGLSKA